MKTVRTIIIIIITGMMRAILLLFIGCQLLTIHCLVSGDPQGSPRRQVVLFSMVNREGH
jgi:hypothetical protein